MAARNKKWIDVTLPVCANMISWPSDPTVEVSEYKGINRGGSSNVSLLKLGSHTGTHIDAPRHFFNDGITIDTMRADAMVGSARVIEIKDRSSICVHEIESENIRPGQSILFRTRNSRAQRRRKGFLKDFVFLTLTAAEYLASRHVKLVGIDSLSVGGYGQSDAAAVHKILLKRKIWIVEGLNLTRAGPGRYDILCLPLRIHRGDAAPARVLLRARK